MKKVLLSSVAALAVFAAATPVFANNQGYIHTGDLDNNKPVEGKDFFVDDASKEFSNELTPAAKNGLNNVDADSTKDKIKAAGETVKPKLDENGKPIPGEFVVEGAAKADAKADAKTEENKDAKKDAKAPAAAGQKALPKTSAVK